MRLLDGLLDLLSPPTCAACDGPLAARSLGFCGACALLVERCTPPPAEARDVDACVYGGPLRDALHRLKYEGRSELAVPLAKLLDDAARSFCGRVDCVIAVPLHPRRLRERGYNQAVLLARAVARSLSVPLHPALLARVRDTEAQVGRGPRQRAAQLAEAFRARATSRGRAVLVVDDVRTTGATLGEARRALHAAGASYICTLALARAIPGEESGQGAGL